MNGPNPADKNHSPQSRITAEQAKVDLSGEGMARSVTAVGGADDYVASLLQGAPGDRLTQGSQGDQRQGVKTFNPYYRSQS